MAAKRSSYLQTPRVVFFVGKYFGTGMGILVSVSRLLILYVGVILATAFIHLLKDAFHNMAKVQVNERWGKYESWPGLVMCVHRRSVPRNLY